MAGGIYPNYPFQINIKCVIFAMIIIGLFFYIPPKMNMYWKMFVSLVLFVVSYVSMAWYDYKFECQKLALKRSTSDYSLTQPLKPPIHTETQHDSSKATKEENRLEEYLIHYYHLFIITPLLLYIGANKNKTENSVYIFLIVNICFAIAYHVQRLWRKYNSVSLGHVVIGLIAIYFSWIIKKPMWYFYIVLGFSAYVGVVHSLDLIKMSHL
jgi:hypothetical protein